MKIVYEEADAVVERVDAIRSYVAPPVPMAMDIVQKCVVAVSRPGAFLSIRNKRSYISRRLKSSEDCLGLLGTIDPCCRLTLWDLACFGTGESQC